MTLNQRIGKFYDDSTDLWLNSWGEHMHHGYYGPDGKREVNHQQAQIDMIEALLEWGQLPDRIDRIFDAGCGVGASSRYLAQRFPGAKTLGLTLSPVQAARGKKLNERAVLAEQCEIRAADVYATDPSREGKFDLIWSMESAEHMGDKPRLFKLFHDLLRPGGTLLMATWCHRDEPPALSSAEQANLNKLCKLYHLPPWTSIPELARDAKDAGFQNIHTDDWSEGISPFWGAVIKESLRPANWPSLLRSGPGTLKGAWAMRYMQKGFREGSIRYGMLTAKKGSASTNAHA
ncbi:SAM-dependent methyltransferase [Lewinellaceae bacterium SD302]|nr:SAM-dependent methyltransferase [Lewinellaceae bacterium SD302]